MAYYWCYVPTSSAVVGTNARTACYMLLRHLLGAGYQVCLLLGCLLVLGARGLQGIRSRVPKQARLPGVVPTGTQLAPPGHTVNIHLGN